MRSIVMPGIFLAGLGLVAGCGSSDDEAPQAVTLELATWWSGMSEVNALNALLAVHKAAHPDVTINIVTLADQQALQSTMQNRFTDGNPPAAFQANLGGSALAWGPSAQSLNASSSVWATDFDPGVLEQLTSGGNLIGVPLALTRQNAAYWNLKILNTLTTLTKKVPETSAEFDTWLTEVSTLGYTHPLCFSGKDAWVSAHIMFEDIVPALEGPDFSKQYWGGSVAADDARMIDALDYAKKIAGYLSPNFVEMDMTDGINKLMAAETDIANQCLMTPMGDWGGAILSENNTPGTDFIGTGWPGKTTNKLVVFGGDTFVAAKGAANQQAVYDFFNTMASKEGQIKFAEKKGSMPARKIPVADAMSLSTLTQANIADLADANGGGLAGYKLIAKATYPVDPLATATRDFMQTKDSTGLVTFLKDNAAQLK